MEGEERELFQNATAALVEEHDFRKINWPWLGQYGTRALCEHINPEDTELLQMAEKGNRSPSDNGLICYVLELQNPGVTAEIVERAKSLKLQSRDEITESAKKSLEQTWRPDKSGIAKFVLKASYYMMPPWMRRHY